MDATTATLGSDVLATGAEGSVPLLGLGGVLILLVALLAIFAGGLLSRMAQIGLRFGIDAGRRAARWGGVLRMGGVVLCAFVVLRGLSGQLSLGYEVGLLVALFALLSVIGLFRDAAGSLHAQFRLQLSEGDRVRVGELQGEIRRIAWDHLRLRTASGEGILVPGRQLLSEAVQVQPLRDAVRVEHVVDERLGEEALGRLADAVAVSPYRVPDTPMRVQPVAGGAHVSLYAWSEQAADAAAAQLTALSHELSTAATTDLEG